MNVKRILIIVLIVAAAYFAYTKFAG